MSELLKTGIYEIKNLINGKRYVGSTIRSFKDRWQSHRSKLNNNKHDNSYLQRAWNKYGSENFEFNILEVVEVQFCIVKEQYWMDHYDVLNDKFGYNLAPTAGNTTGYIYTEEVRQKLSILNSGENNPCYGRTGDKHPLFGKHHSEETKQKMRKSSEMFKYKVITPDNEEIIITNLREFCRNNNLGRCEVSKVVNGTQNKTKGYKITKII